jgi:exosortase
MAVRDWGLVVILLAVFAPALAALSDTWSGVDYYSHGYLIPLVALWAATSQRGLLPTLPATRDVRGLLAIALALAAYLVGLAAAIVPLQGLALVVAVAGAVLYLRGPAWLRALMFPLGYLLFMVPLPEAWITPVIVRLQMIVSSVGVGVLRLIDVPVLREGNVLQLASGESLFVAEACSGITSIVTLLPLAVFLAYFTERSLGRRLVLVAAVFPLAMFGNLLRVIGTVIAAGYVGVERATGGLVHDSAGLLTYVIGCLALLGVGALMRMMLPEPIPSQPS